MGGRGARAGARRGAGAAPLGAIFIDVWQAVAYDNPVPGYDTFNTINLRLWKSTPAKEFDFASFNSGDYLKASATHARRGAVLVLDLIARAAAWLRGAHGRD